MKTNCLQSYQYWFKSSTSCFMPQLDVVTFINQYIWIIGSVTIMVIIMLSIVLPSVKSLMQIRTNTSVELVNKKRERSYSSFKKLINFSW